MTINKNIFKTIFGSIFSFFVTVIVAFVMLLKTMIVFAYVGFYAVIMAFKDLFKFNKVTLSTQEKNSE